MSVYAKPYAEREGSEIVDYGTFAVEFRASSHRYWLHKDEERTAAISVTSALKVLDKAALIPWAEKMGVEGALRLERDGQLQNVPIEQAIGIMRMHGQGADAKREAGADRGTAVHEAIRVYCADGTVPKVGDFPGEVRGYVSACCKWLLKAQPTPLEIECVIASPTHGYAGRLDLIAEVDGRIVLVDFKTSPTGRVYDEAHVQTAAYLGALPECGIENVDSAIIVAFGEEGGYEDVACEADHADFLSVLDTCRRMSRIRAARTARERAPVAA